VLSGGLAEAGWTSVEANKQNEEKNRTFSHTYFMFADGERGGPMGTYLVSADARDNFDLWTNTAVRRAVRTGGQVTGVELECLSNGGLSGSVKLNPGGGVIFSAGAFGSAKLLLRSKLCSFGE
jgi:cellobiose dehydrogenase (acceptor)